MTDTTRLETSEEETMEHPDVVIVGSGMGSPTSVSNALRSSTPFP
jgi:hypothetical protein